MNLHGIVAGAVSAVNPQILASVQVSTGNTLGATGKQTPTYAPAVTVPAQVQALQYKDIEHMDALNIQGTRRAIYLYGRIDGLVRSTGKGGDLITITSGVNAGVWLVAVVAEQWPDWCKALCTLQNEAP